MSGHISRHRWLWLAVLAAGWCLCFVGNWPAAEAANPADLAASTNDAPFVSPFVVQRWQVEDGLPHNSVNEILQTRDGYLWLATNDGLARFDGVHFTVFGLREGLPSLRVLVLLEDRDGALWVGTGQGLCRLQDGRFDTWTTRNGLAGNEVTSLGEDSSGAIWVGTVTGLSRWQQGRLRTFGKAEGLNDRRVRALTPMREGGVLVSMFYESLFQWDGNRFVQWAKQADVSPAPPGCLLQDRKGRLWAGLAGGIVLCRTEARWRQYGRTEGLPPNNILALSEGADGTIWAAAGGGGLYKLASGNPAAVWQRALFANEGVISLLEDREQNLWVGTRSRGLARLKPKRVSVVPILSKETETEPRTLAETPDGTLWIGTSSQGLFRLEHGKLDPFLREAPVRGFPYVSAVLAARDNSVWWGAGPALFQWKDGKLVSDYSLAFRSWLREDRIRALCEDREGGIWVGTQNGQLRMLRGGEFIAFTNAQPAAPVTDLLQQADGTLLIGTYGKGLLRLHDGECSAALKQNGPPSLFILSLHQDSAGVLWIGTEGAGLIRVEHGRLSTLTTRNGLISDTIVQILEDGAGCLWLGSYRGILRVSKQELADFAQGTTDFVHPLILNRSDGLPSEQCMRGFSAGRKTRDGSLHFSTSRGIVVVNPNQAWTNTAAPAVWLETVLADGAVYHARIQPASHPTARAEQPAGVQRTENLKLPPGKRRLEFQYTGLSLGAPESVRFRYRLEGLDDRWIEAGRERSASYSLLPAGNYRFHVTACDNSGIWNEQGAMLAFAVEPFFWQTWWFRLGLLAALGAGLVAVVRYVSFRRLRLRLRRLEQETAVQKERARIAKDLHDDLGAHLSQIGMLSELAQSDFQKPEQAQGHLDLIFRTARSVTRSLDEIVWAVNPRNDSLDRFVAHICTFAPEFLRAAGVSCRLDVPMDLPSTELPANVRHHLYLAFKEALNNVVKHAGASEVWLRLRLGPRELSLIIEDNGRGFHPQTEGAPGEDGLVNLRQRMTDIGGRFEQHSEPSQGTRTVLIAPLGSEVA
jgi:ligand-binding sensor domain-containing protein/signal transduction histidine kinase